MQLAFRLSSGQGKKRTYFVVLIKAFIFRIAVALDRYSQYAPPTTARELTRCKIAMGTPDLGGFSVLDPFADCLGGTRSMDHDKNDKNSAMV